MSDATDYYTNLVKVQDAARRKAAVPPKAVDTEDLSDTLTIDGGTA